MFDAEEILSLFEKPLKVKNSEVGTICNREANIKTNAQVDMTLNIRILIFQRLDTIIEMQYVFHVCEMAGNKIPLIILLNMIIIQVSNKCLYIDI